MTDIIEKRTRANELPPHLRGDIEGDAEVLVSVRRLTANGFTLEFEDHVLKAASSGSAAALEGPDAVAALRKIMNEDNIH